MMKIQFGSGEQTVRGGQETDLGVGRQKKVSSTRLGRYPLFLVYVYNVVW
jgi:hypothetical protein